MMTHPATPVVRPQATVAIILGKPAAHPAAASPDHHSHSPAAEPAHFRPEAGHQTATGIREEIRRRYETPFRLHGWEHVGIND